VSDAEIDLAWLTPLPELGERVLVGPVALEVGEELGDLAHYPGRDLYPL